MTYKWYLVFTIKFSCTKCSGLTMVHLTTTRSQLEIWNVILSRCLSKIRTPSLPYTYFCLCFLFFFVKKLIFAKKSHDFSSKSFLFSLLNFLLKYESLVSIKIAKCNDLVNWVHILLVIYTLYHFHMKFKKSNVIKRSKFN